MLMKLYKHIRDHGIYLTILKIIKTIRYGVFLNIYLPVVKKTNSKFVKSYYGVSFKRNFSDVTFNFYIRAFYGFYFSGFLENIQENYVLLDIGANQGLYSIIAAKNPKCIKVLAFEPVSSTYSLLCENVAHNMQSSKIQLINAAISDSDAEREIGFSASHSGVASLDHISGMEGSEIIKCISFKALDSLIQENQKISLVVKIDTEGHEAVVIDQLRQSACWPDIEFLYFEVDSRWIEGEKLIQSLVSEGFSERYRSSVGSHFDVMMHRVIESH